MFDTDCNYMPGETCQAGVCQAGGTPGATTSNSPTKNLGDDCNDDAQCKSSSTTNNGAAVKCETLHLPWGSTQMCEACATTDTCDTMAFPTPGTLDCYQMTTFNIRKTVEDLLADPERRQDQGVAVGCPGNGCEQCKNAEYSTATDLTCLKCPPGTKGAGSEGAISEALGCPVCPGASVQPLAGQTECTACPDGANTTDKTECLCKSGYGRSCSAGATLATVSG